MPIRVYYEVLNQKGTPALYSDNYAQRPAAGYVGRIFYSPDTAQIFYDTGSTWTLLADAGVGSGSLASVCANGNTTATGISITAGGLSSNSITNTSNTAGSVLFAGASGVESQSNATFFWDNTNKRLGLGNNAPGVTLDIHGTGGTLVQLNGTGTNNSYLQFQNAGVGKWRIGNNYNANANDFIIYDSVSAINRLSISNAGLLSITGNEYISGSLGIGVAASNTYKLDVNAGTGLATSGRFQCTSFATNVVIGASSSQVGLIKTLTGESLAIGVNDTTIAQYISSNGNIGFGTTTPSLSVEIAKAGAVALRINNTTSTGDSYIQHDVVGSSFSIGVNTSGWFSYTGGTKKYDWWNANIIRMSLSTSNNLILGDNPSDNGNKLQINGDVWGTGLVRGDRFTSNSSYSTSITFNVFTTFYTMTSTYGGIYLVILCLDGQNTADWAASAIIYTNGTSSTILTQQNGTLVSITTSGLNIQGRQIGTAPNLNMSYRILKINQA